MSKCPSRVHPLDVVFMSKLVDYDNSCRGLGGVDVATSIVKGLFETEGISFDGWKVSEIPLTADLDEWLVKKPTYSIGPQWGRWAAICVVNRDVCKGFSFHVAADDGEVEIFADEICDVEVSSIKEAIEHEASSY